MKALGLTELAILRGFVRDVIHTCESDVTDTCLDLYDPALQCAEILGIVVEDKLGDDYDDYTDPDEKWIDTREIE